MKRLGSRAGTTALAALIGVLVLGVACSRSDHDGTTGDTERGATDTGRDVGAIGKTSTDPGARDDDEENLTPIRAEFLRVADELYGGSDFYFGRQQLAAWQGALDVPNLPLPRRIQAHAKLSVELLRVGDIDACLEHIGEARRLAEGDPAMRSVMPQILRNQGMMYLRKAELENCIARHNAECCQFPLRGGGVHEVRSPAESAAECFERFLQLEPGDLRVRWLLNLTHMALGDHPEGVPERDRIPPSAFESDADIGRFANIASDVGIDSFDLAGGSLVEDFDGDGFLDIITSTVDPRGSMTYYRNRGDGTFEDRTAVSGLIDQLGGLNCISGDYDDDGDVDVLVLRGAWLFEAGQIRNSLLRNGGDGTFTDVTHAAGLATPARPTQAATFLDYDLDGDLDLYVGNESRAGAEAGQDFPSQLFRNEGDGTFADVSAAAGVTNDRYCKGVAAGDYDNDGDPDLYVSNIRDNRLYRNNGDGTFTDVAFSAGVAEPRGRAFATWFFDHDNDGWLDIFCAAYDASVEAIASDYLGLQHQATGPKLYRNQGDGTFRNVAPELGLDRPFLPMGANFGDLDNDGWLDVALATGDPNFETLVPNVMLRNDGARAFQDVTTSGGFGHLQKGHGVSFADIDNDGDQDVHQQLGGMLMADQYFNALFQNPGHGNAFVIVELVGRETNHFGVGARVAVTVDTPEGSRTLHRAVGSVSSFGGSPLRQEIGLGDATAITEIVVEWPVSGDRTRVTNVRLNSRVRVSEMDGPAEPETLPLTRVTLP